jgi:hypothetical protein
VHDVGIEAGFIRLRQRDAAYRTDLRYFLSGAPVTTGL